MSELFQELENWRLEQDKSYQELADAIEAVTGRRRDQDCWRKLCLGQTPRPHSRTVDIAQKFMDAQRVRTRKRMPA